MPTGAVPCQRVSAISIMELSMAWLAKLLADAREADISVLIVQALVILSGLGLLLSLVAGLAFGLDFPPNLF